MNLKHLPNTYESRAKNQFDDENSRDGSAKSHFSNYNITQNGDDDGEEIP